MKNISVIVTCFNLENYIDECIDSIKQQIKAPFEIIVIHDGCKEVSKTYPGVTSVLCDKNKGVTAARDMGFKMSTGNYVMFFDGDDVMPPNYLMQMSYTDADVVYPNCVLWAGWGNSGKENVWHEAPAKLLWKHQLVTNEVLMPSLFKREWYDKVGGFDPTLPIFEDYDFWLRIQEKGATFAKSCAFLMYRQRTLSRNHQDDATKREFYHKIAEKFTLKDKKASKV